MTASEREAGNNGGRCLKILHVSLGLPPFRTGGLNRYCVDLMREQKKLGETVELLYPGEFLPGGKTRIVWTKNPEFEIYRIQNPLPLALTNGISAPERYMRVCKNPEIYYEFLEKHRPDVIHVHSFQGIHSEFFSAAKKLKIRMVFTTHDYYPFCPNCVLMQRNGAVCMGPEGEKCAVCNQGRGLSPLKEVVMQSRTYEKLKYSLLVKKLRSSQVKSVEAGATAPEAEACEIAAQVAEAYDRLQQYYLEILKTMDAIHANSGVSQKIYEKYVPEMQYCQLGITHGDIHTCSHIRDSHALRLGYVGGLNRYKGLAVLLKAVDILENHGVQNYELWLYGADYEECARKNPHIHNGGMYNAETEDSVWASFDTLIIPSQCHETFGFVAAEAIAHGVSVICSDLVGAKQLLGEENIFQHDSPAALAEAIAQPHNVPDLSADILSMEKHALRIKNELYDG